MKFLETKSIEYKKKNGLIKILIRQKFILRIIIQVKADKIVFNQKKNFL